MTFLLIVLVTSIKLNAQSDSEINNSIRINALGLFTGFYELQYERLISEKGDAQFPSTGALNVFPKFKPLPMS